MPITWGNDVVNDIDGTGTTSIVHTKRMAVQFPSTAAASNTNFNHFLPAGSRFLRVLLIKSEAGVFTFYPNGESVITMTASVISLDALVDGMNTGDLTAYIDYILPAE